MSGQPRELDSDLTSMDQALDRFIARYRERGRVELGSELLRAALRDRLEHEGFTINQMQLLEVNLLGGISGWMEFVLQERQEGRDRIPDFVRHLRTAFFSHCREHKIDPDEAVKMSLELASAIMEMACAFRRQLTIGGFLPTEG